MLFLINSLLSLELGCTYIEETIIHLECFLGSLLSQISYRSTISKLANKFYYPTLFRTSASDESQAQTLADIVKHFRWRKVCKFFIVLIKVEVTAS